MNNRNEQIEEAAKTEFPWSLPQIHDAFISGACWADYTNLDSLKVSHLEREVTKLKTALNRIGIAQMGELE